MVSKHFHKELDDYLDRRKKNKDSKIKFSFVTAKKEERVPNLAPKKVHVLYKKPGLFERVFARDKKDPMLAQLKREEEKQVKLEYMRGQMELTDKEIEQIMKEQEGLEKKRKSIFSRFVKAVNIFKKEEEKMVDMALDEEEKAIASSPDPELIEAVKISAKWLGKLSPEDKKAFKESSEFHRYKSICEKHGLTKKR